MSVWFDVVVIVVWSFEVVVCTPYKLDVEGPQFPRYAKIWVRRSLVFVVVMED